MTGAAENRPKQRRADSRSRFGLRLRLWIGTLGGPLIAVAGSAWVLWPYFEPQARVEAGPLVAQLSVVLAASLIVGIVLAAWLDYGIVTRLRSLAQGMVEGLMLERPGRPTHTGWGEITVVSRGVEALLARQRQLAWSLDEFERLKREIADARQAIERWALTERWQAPPAEEGILRSLLEPLDRGLARQREVSEQNQEAGHQMLADLKTCLVQARESAEHAEHGFVEATAALTTANELHRLAGELQQLLAERPADREAPSRSVQAWRSAATAAIEELVTGASESVEHLAAGFLRMQEIGEQVHLLSNRATLIALHTLLTGSRPDETAAPSEDLHAELKQLALEVRSSTSRVAELSTDLEREIRIATERMRGIRERVMSRLEQIPEVAEPAPASLADDVRRPLERLREMAQDSARKSERVTRSTEHASRAAQDVLRKLEEEGSDLEGLIVRLTPPSDGDALAPMREPGGEARPTGLRVIERPATDDPRTLGRGEPA